MGGIAIAMDIRGEGTAPPLAAIQSQRPVIGGSRRHFGLGRSDARLCLDQLDCGVGGRFLAAVDQEEVARPQIETAPFGMGQSFG